MAHKPAIPDGLPLLEAGCAAADLDFGNGSDFWENLDERTAAFGLDDVLDRALAGRSTPRTWILVHEPGHPQLAAAAALGLARALAGRGQAVLVLDGDDHATALSRWAGRENTEGWIDVVRYGTSVLTSGVALPYAGRAAYLLGVGSYAPTEATPQEIEQLLGRLRRQADDVLVVLPGGVQAAAWAKRADIRVLCHDQATLSPQRLAAVVANLTDAGVAPTALLGFGQAQAVPARPVEPATDAGDDDRAAPDPDAPAHDLPAAGGAAAVLDDLAAAEEDAAPEAEPDPEFARRRGTSRVFWLVAVVATLLIAMVGVYYVKYVRVPDGGLFGEAPAAVADRGAGDGGAAARPDATMPAAPDTLVPTPTAVAAGADTAAAPVPAATTPPAGSGDGAAAAADRPAAGDMTTPAAGARPGPARPSPPNPRPRRPNRRRPSSTRRPTRCPWAPTAGPCRSTRSGTAPPPTWRCSGWPARACARRCGWWSCPIPGAGTGSTWGASPAGGRPGRPNPPSSRNCAPTGPSRRGSPSR